MAIGFLVTTVSPNLQVVPDRAFASESTPRVLIARFGDGYEQRLADGINTIEEQYSVAFVNRTKEEIDDIVYFFKSLKGVTSFELTIPDSNSAGSPYTGETTIKVVCDKFNTVYVNTNCYTCTANFRRVYEA